MNPALLSGREFVAYYRISKEKKGRRGKGVDEADAEKLEALGLQAQVESVARYVASQGGEVVNSYREIESGKRHENRPGLKSALAECKERKAMLVIARLDRLGRNVHFVTGLLESKVEFVACDNPHATKVTIQLLAVMAEHERDMISQRTKAALAMKSAELKLQGKRLGCPNPRENLAAAWKGRTSALPAPQILTDMDAWKAEGKTLRWIADKLNGYNIRTHNGKQWHPTTVKRILERAEKETEAK